MYLRQCFLDAFCVQLRPFVHGYGLQQDFSNHTVCSEHSRDVRLLVEAWGPPRARTNVRRSSLRFIGCCVGFRSHASWNSVAAPGIVSQRVLSTQFSVMTIKQAIHYSEDQSVLRACRCDLFLRECSATMHGILVCRAVLCVAPALVYVPGQKRAHGRWSSIEYPFPWRVRA